MLHLLSKEREREKMKICDKCNGKSKDFKDFGIHGSIRIGERTVHLCQDCYFKTYKFVTNKDYMSVMFENGV